MYPCMSFSYILKLVSTLIMKYFWNVIPVTFVFEETQMITPFFSFFSYTRLARSCSRPRLWGFHQPDPTWCLRGPPDPSFRERWHYLWVSSHDELQRAEPRLRLRKVRWSRHRLHRRHDPASLPSAGGGLPDGAQEHGEAAAASGGSSD